MLFDMEGSTDKQLLNANVPDQAADTGLSHETLQPDSAEKTVVPEGNNDEGSKSNKTAPNSQAAKPTTAMKKKRVKINMPKERIQSGANKNNNNTAPLPKIKLVRHKRKPSRYQDCLFDIPTKLMNINRTISAEVFRECHKRTPKTLKPKSKEKQSREQQHSPPHNGQIPVFCVESAGDAVTFDEEGNFRFKVCKEHTIRSKLGGVTSYRCDICDMLFPRSFSLSRHYERLHINPRFIRNKGKKDQEIISKLTPPNGQETDKGIKKGDSEKGVVNAITATDRSTSDAEIPAETISDEKSEDNDASFFLFACKLCSRQKIYFTRKEELRRHHQAKHGNLVRKMLNVFKCDSCERSYPTRHELRRHQRSHSGERPYACRFCAKRFPTSTNARRHERTHTGDRPHLCKVCKKGFIQKTDMVKHLRSVHKMKVTKTKAERAVKKKSKVTKHSPEVIPSAAPTLPTAPIQTAAPIKQVRDKTNQFEENIDFAAYLKLDQFEKGSLMGGQSVLESTIINNGAIGAASTQGPGSESVVKGPLDDPQIPNPIETLGVDGKPRRSHKCTECPKSFTSQVNLRRHFRLKHERNQVVRAAMPVSMVVEKFKIQDEEEGKDDENRKATIPDGEEKKTSSPQTTKEKKNEKLDPQDIQANLATVSAAESTVVAELPTSPAAVTTVQTNLVSTDAVVTKELSPRKVAGKQHGSKLSSILQRLSNRQDSALKSNTAQSTEEAKQQATVGNDAQRRTNKRKLPVPSQRGDFTPEPSCSRRPSLVQESDLFPMPEEEVPSRLLDKAANSLRSPQRQQAAGEVRKIRARTFHPYHQAAAPVMSPKEIPHKFSMRKTKYSMPEAIPNYFVTFSSTPTQESANADVTYTVAYPKRHSIPSTHHEEMWSPQNSSIILRKPSTSYRNRSSHNRPHISPVAADNVHAALYKTAQPPRPKPPRPTVNLEYRCTNSDLNPLNLKVSGSKRPREQTKDSPLDLRHPSKKHTQDYIVTDNGVLDFSKKTRESLQEKPDESKSDDVPLALTKCLRPTEQGHEQENQSAFYCLSKPQNHRTLQKQDPPTCMAQTLAMNLPLKFHDVKFHKGRQVDGAGTAGRPMSLRRINRSQRPRLNQGDQMTAHQHLSDSRFHPYSASTSSRMQQNSPNLKRQPPQYAGERRYSDDRFVPIVSTSGRSHQPPPADVIREQLLSARYQDPSGNSSRGIKNFRRQPPRYPTQRSLVQYPPFGPDQHSENPPSHAATDIRPRRGSLDSASRSPERISKQLQHSKQGGGRHNKLRLSAADLDRDVMTRCIQKAQFELRMHAAADARQQQSQLPSAQIDYNHSKQMRKFHRESVSRVLNSPRVDVLSSNEAGPNNVAPTLHNINDHQLLTRNENVRQASIDSTSEGNELLHAVPLQGATKDSPSIKQRVSSRNELTMTPGFDTNGEDSSRDGDEADRVAPSKSSVSPLQPGQPSSPGGQLSSDHTTNLGDREKAMLLPDKIFSEHDEKDEPVSYIPRDSSQCIDSIASVTNILDTGNIMGCETAEDVSKSNYLPEKGSTLLEKSCKMFSSQHTAATSPSGIKETNLSTETGTSDDCQLRETNLSKFDSATSKCENESPVSVSSPDRNLQEQVVSPGKLNAVEAVESSRKFVQKLKLRAVKSQDGATKTQWTLVGNGQSVPDKVPEEESEADILPDPILSNNKNEKPKDDVSPRQKSRAPLPRRRSKGADKSTPKLLQKPEPVVQKETAKPKQEGLSDDGKQNVVSVVTPAPAAKKNLIVEGEKKVEQKCEANHKPAANEMVETNKYSFVVLLEREAVHSAVLALQTEQQVKRALRHEKNLMLKSKRDETQVGEIPNDEATVKTDDTKSRMEMVECIGKNVDIKSDGEDGKECGSTVATTNSSYVRRSAKQNNANDEVEIVPVVKDHTYVKQDRNAGKAQRENNGEEIKKKRDLKPGNKTSRKTATAGPRRAKEKRTLRRRSVGVAQKKAGPSKAASNVAKNSVVKQTFAPQTSPTTVVIKADFLLKVPTTSPLAPKAVARKIDLSKILPPVNVHTKRRVPVLSGSSSGRNLSNNRRSIRKYSKDFLPK